MIKQVFSIALLSCAVLTANAQSVYQVPNGDFETWTYDGENLPNNWNSFQTADGTLKSTAYSSRNRQVKRSTDKRPGSQGQYSCSIWARKVVVAVAQGNLTSGRVYAVDMKADKNYNKSDRSGSTTNNGVVNPCAMKFNGHPDAVSVWMKFQPKNTAHEARFSAIIHDDYDYTVYGNDDYDTDTNKSHRVAIAAQDFTECGWTQLVLPFDYSENDNNNAQYVIINASTNAIPGKGSENDYLYIDDIEMLYYHSLASLKYNGATVPNFSETTTTYDLTSQYYESDKLAYTLNGLTAAATKSYNATTGVLTLTVSAEDGSKTEYTLKFKPCSATMSVKAASKYATFIAPFAVTVPSGITAQTITGIDAQDKIVLGAKLTTIPANTPVFLTSTKTTDYSTTFTGLYVKATSLTSGLLTGTYSEVYAPVGSYVLQNHNDRVGFFRVESGKQPKVSAFHCYMNAPSSSAAAAFYFDDEEPTGIEAPTVEQGETTIYDLQGRKIQSGEIKRGIYIINGKKVIF